MGENLGVHVIVRKTRGLRRKQFYLCTKHIIRLHC